MKEKNNKSIKYIITIIILIIIILILMFFAKFGAIESTNILIPTGNIDVFDIYIGCMCTDKDNCTTKDQYGNETKIPVYNETENNNKKMENDESTGDLYVYDKNGSFIYQQNLKIFENAAYQYTNKIAPGVSNTYNFVVHNSNNFKIKYSIEMNEAKEYDINLKYRLRKNNKYIIGNENTWVSANELKTLLENIGAGTSDTYSLDWNWPYESGNDEKDTNAGKNMNEEYKLNVQIYIEQAV